MDPLSLGGQRLQENLSHWIDAWDDALAMEDWLADPDSEPQYVVLLNDETGDSRVWGAHSS